MPVYKELDPEVLEQMLKPYRDEGEDTLGKERRHEEAFLKQQQCPTCGASGMIPFLVSTRHAYGHGNLLARNALRCTACGTEYDPHSRIVLGTGNLAQAVEAMQANQVPLVGDNPVSLDQMAERVRRRLPG
ncbi:MAG TPA: hypothetical protein PKW90_26090 [Myxococcota bacterium]|nr:hypothetical protein [Myxococcota bacterium]